MKTVLIIDDEEKLRALLTRIISLEGFEVLGAGDGKTGLAMLKQADVDVVLCDVKLPDASGVELAATIKERFPQVEIILLTAYGNIPDSVQAIKNGAFDYITKGDDNSRIIPLLYRAVEKAALAKRVRQLEKQLGERYSFARVVGQSASLMQAVDLARRVAQTDTTVLLTGETGTGKEVFAQAIHQESARRTHNFVAINCSAFGKEMLESEMFGHRAGAFTGAIKDHKGLFDEANRGTIFLDEIGEMALELQAKLLRVLETGEFIRIGESKPTRVDVRILAATHRDLRHEIEAGHFREDLFYRISVFQIRLPALRERTEDVAQLAAHFLDLFSAKTNKKVTAISGDFLKALQNHPWNGNIRELKNVIERAVILSNSPELTPDLLPVDMQPALASASAPRQLSAFELASAEKIHIQKVLNYTQGNKTKTAELLGIALTTLYRKLAEYRLS
ncbi:sigma-54-dependent transcriptional regulator [Arundinibacter roseus]|uniref:Sigma-54-dependent Fis family transcriptional regulator n=1 Tax=Arundinibacter roseus TaxID=2070510 RepID=A0A4R4KKV3_9BACT|nr:sigma-54 dependent transcriptional regulator [Arundinibacter roseus]TDB68920.1 sigma-54-dependent Fis family transcriptional regulator [Arundinibacter roseus]